MKMINPKPVVIDAGNKAVIKLQYSPSFIRSVNGLLGEGKELQKYVDTVIMESIEPYVPRGETGVLQNSVKLNSTVGSGKLIWKTPYAHYQYAGVLYVDPDYKIGAFHDRVSGKYWSRKGVPKEKTNIPLTYSQSHGGGKRGAEWPQRYLNDNLSILEKKIQLKAGELLRL